MKIFKNPFLNALIDLLRRLSRSQNTVFCGRILLFLAKFFPFSERSGLNVVSEFNLDNLTTFGVRDDSSSSLDVSGATIEKEKITSEVEQRYIKVLFYNHVKPLIYNCVY